MLDALAQTVLFVPFVMMNKSLRYAIYIGIQVEGFFTRNKVSNVITVDIIFTPDVDTGISNNVIVAVTVTDIILGVGNGIDIDVARGNIFSGFGIGVVGFVHQQV